MSLFAVIHKVYVTAAQNSVKGAQPRALDEKPTSLHKRLRVADCLYLFCFFLLGRKLTIFQEGDGGRVYAAGVGSARRCQDSLSRSGVMKFNFPLYLSEDTRPHPILRQVPLSQMLVSLVGYVSYPVHR